MENGKLSVKDILGFKIKGASVFIPRVPCRHINPPTDVCPKASDSGNSIFSLAPVYDTIIYPIHANYNEYFMDEKLFEKVNNVSLINFKICRAG